MKIRVILAIMSLISLLEIKAQTATLVPPGNQNYAGLEKNVLFYANRKFTVTQTGSAQFNLAGLFDGSYGPLYSTVPPSISDPTVITIENIPGWHTQRGALVGWSTRYWPATKFKIEGFENDENTWKTFADVQDFTSNLYSVMVYGNFSKLRFTFYTASGDGGNLGLSELFFLHNEQAVAYDDLMVKYDGNGNVGIGTTNPQTKLDVDGIGSFKTSVYLKNNGVSSTELLIYKDQDHYYDIGGNSHSFFIYNSSTNNHLLYATSNDNIGIGTTTPSEKLSVNGNIRSRKVIVTQTGWPDYVFEPSYQLPSLDSVHNFIKENKHLPGMASAAVVEKEGLDLGEVVKQQQQKIEELMLYMIEMKKGNEKKYEKLEMENKELKNRIKTLETQKQ